MIDNTKNEILVIFNIAEFNSIIDGSGLLSNFSIIKFNDNLSALDHLEKCIYPQFVIVLENLPTINGVELINFANEKGIKHKFIIISDINSIPRAVEAIKAGADDYTIYQQLSELELLNLIDKVWGIPLDSKKSKKIKDQERFERILLTRLSISDLSLTHSLDKLIQVVIDESEQLTGSSIGFFHFLSKDQKTLTLQTWSTNTLNKMCTAEGKNTHYPVERAGVWADCIQLRKPIIHNDYESLTNKKGLPIGHASIIRELVLPIFEGDNIVAILGVGNKETDYDTTDIDSLTQLSQYAWDIIKSKRIEEALRESEERYRYMFEHHPQPMFIYDLETLQILQVNNAIIDNYGYTKEEFLSMTLMDFHLQEDLDELKKDIEKTRSSNNPTGTWRNVKKNGDIIYIEIVAHTVFYNNRIARHILISDITKRKQIEDALIESENRYRSLFDNSTIGLYRTSPSGRIVMANPTIVRLLGYNSFEELSQRNLEVEGYESPNSRKHFHQLLLENGEIRGYESVWVKKDGSKVYVRESAKAICSPNGKILFYEGTIEDITERKEAEEKLINAANQWQITFDTVQDGVCLLDKDQRIIRCNQVMSNFFPNYQENMIGKRCWEVVHNATNPMIECPINKMRKSLKRESVELKLNDRWFDITVDPIFDAENGYNGAVHIVRNITARKKAEESLLQLNNQLKSLNATKDKLFSIVAHDLKSPFNSILGFSELLINNLHNYSDDKIDGFLSQINASAKSTLSLIDNLLIWANTQMGHIEYKPEHLDLLTIVHEITEQLRSTAKIKNITISFFQAQDYTVFADKNMLEIILRNLLSNAIKFTKQNGKIAIYAISINHMLEITVSDDGIGIDEKILSKLFADNETITTNGTANEKGSGLGLMLCKEFVEKLGGKIWVESEVGVGSEFKFTLPKN